MIAARCGESNGDITTPGEQFQPLIGWDGAGTPDLGGILDGAEAPKGSSLRATVRNGCHGSNSWTRVTGGDRTLRMRLLPRERDEPAASSRAVAGHAWTRARRVPCGHLPIHVGCEHLPRQTAAGILRQRRAGDPVSNHSRRPFRCRRGPATVPAAMTGELASMRFKPRGGLNPLQKRNVVDFWAQFSLLTVPQAAGSIHLALRRHSLRQSRPCSEERPERGRPHAANRSALRRQADLRHWRSVFPRAQRLPPSFPCADGAKGASHFVSLIRSTWANPRGAQHSGIPPCLRPIPVPPVRHACD